MTTSTLFVPIHVDGLFVKTSVNGVGANADFSRLPHLAQDKNGNVYDANASHPWITDTISDEPFANVTSQLDAGVHLHWAMPDMLTRARHPVDQASGQKDRSTLKFPVLPNRWLIQRRASGVVQASWVIESDYLWPHDHPWGEFTKSAFTQAFGVDGNDIWNTLHKIGWLKGAGDVAVFADPKDRKSNDLGQHRAKRAAIIKTVEDLSLKSRGHVRKLVSMPYNNETSDGFSKPDNPPFRRVGRVRALGVDWEVLGTAEYMSHKTTGPLTAVGYGEPSFAAFYPNCRSIFGFHDDIHGHVRDYSYDVYGWYSNAEDDPLSLAPDDVAAFGPWLKHHLQWDAPLSGTEAPQKIVCFGRVSSSSFIPQTPGDLHGKPAPKSRDDFSKGLTVTLGNTGTEALSAYVAGELALARHGARDSEREAEKRKIEDYLEALHASDDLEHRMLDVGAKFQEARRDNTFLSLPGGRIWTMQIEASKEDTGQAAKRPKISTATLPENLVAALSDLNQFQRDYERAQNAITAMRQQVHTDWQRYMRFAYPPDDQALDQRAARDEHDVDEAVGFLRYGSIQVLNALIEDAGRVEFIATKNRGPHQPDLKLFKGTGTSSIAARLVEKVAQLRTALNVENAAAGNALDAVHWALETAPAPRFYRPKDPVVLLSHSDLKPTDRHGEDHGADGLGVLECHQLDCDLPSGETLSSDDAVRAVANVAHVLFARIDKSPDAKIGVRKGARKLGHPFMLEWEASIAPISTTKVSMSTDRRFDPNFIRKNWTLDDTDRILKEKHPATALSASASVVTGRGYLTPHADRILYQRLETYIMRRLEEYFEAKGVETAERTLNYLQSHYPRIRAWMVAQGADRLAADAGRDLLLLQAAVPHNARFGLALDGTSGGVIRVAVNSVSYSELVSLANLAEDEALTLVLRRAGASFIFESFFKDDVKSQSDFMTACQLDADLREVFKGADFEALIAYLTGQSDTNPSSLALDLSSQLIEHLPAQETTFGQLITFLHKTMPGKISDGGAISTAPVRNKFASFEAISTLAIFNENEKTRGAAITSKLLRFVHSNQFFGVIAHDLAQTQESPPVMGVPTGGPLEAGILRYVKDHIEPGDMTLSNEALIPDFVVEALRIAQPIQSLADLAAVKLVSTEMFAKLFHAADRNQDYISINIGLSEAKDLQGEVGGANYAIKASAGHAWSDPILTALDAWKTLKAGFATVTQNLSGFNDALLMQRRRWQLDVADPIGFLDYRAFTEKTVRRVVGEQATDAITSGPFVPIRSGGLSLKRLRLIDNFGQITDIQAPHVATTNGMEGQGDHQAVLPPRIVQPARLNFRWLDSVSGIQEWNQHPETSPICGWVVLNNFEGRLMIHALGGEPLGSLDPLGNWHPPAGPDGGVTTPDSIINDGLRRLVKWLQTEARQQARNAKKSDQPFVAAFLDLCETALENIDPETFKNREATSLLMGRPMAVVRAVLSMECRDPFATDQGLNTFGKEIQGAPRNTHGFEKVQFPVRIGEHMQLNDGVVGVWQEAGDAFAITSYELASLKDLTDIGVVNQGYADLKPLQGKVFDTAEALYHALSAIMFDGDPSETGASTIMQIIHRSARRQCRAPQSDWVRNKDLLTARAGRQDLNLWLDISGPPAPTSITVLMDPRGSLHATCSVLPTKSLEIPPRDFVKAMNRINISLMTAPILTDRDAVNLPLARENGWSWSWISKKGAKWSKLPAIPEIDLAAFEKHFGKKTGHDIWLVLMGACWLEPIGDTADRARVLPSPATKETPVDRLRNGRSAASLGDFSGKAEAILTVIELNSQAIGNIPLDARFAPQEIIEGWMLLSPADHAHFGRAINPGDDLNNETNKQPESDG